MSDSVVKLRIDSKEYDANIKRAGDALTQYFQKVREGGGTLMHLDEGVMEAVQAMGEMGTMAKNAKGGLRELTQATTDMTIAYRNLTDEERNSPLGQAMQQSIQQMTDRAGDLRDAMDDVNQSIKNTASDTKSFDQIAGAANVATSGFQVLQGATKMLGIEMGNDVEVIAKLQAAMAVTNGLSAIQAALQKQSAFMQGVMAAKTALASIAQQAYAVATGEATAAQVAFNIAADANPYGAIIAAVGALVGVITAFAAVTGESTEEVKDAKTEMDALTASVNAAAEAYGRLANKIKSMGIGGQKEYSMLRQAKVDQYNQLAERYSNVGYNMRFYEQRGETDSPIYQQLKEEHTKIKEEADKIKKDIQDLDNANRDRVDRLNQYKRLDFSDVTTQAEAESAIAFLKDQIKYVDNTTTAYKQLKRAIEYAETTVLPQFGTDKPVKAVKQTIKKVKDEAKKEPIEVEIEPTGDMTNFEKLQQKIRIELSDKNIQIDETTLHNLMKDAIQHGIDGMDLDFQDIQQKMAEGLDIPDEAWQKIIDKYNALRTAIGDNPIKINLKTGNEETNHDNSSKGDKDVSILGNTQKITSGIGSMKSSLEDLGIKIPAGLNEVVTKLSAIVNLTSSIATIVSAISALTTAQTLKFWNGGGVVHAAGGMIVPGNYNSGDLVPSMIESGELILNRSQQNNIASQLQEAENGFGGGNAIVRVSGEYLYIPIKNFLRRTGQGEIVTWKNIT